MSFHDLFRACNCFVTICSQAAKEVFVRRLSTTLGLQCFLLSYYLVLRASCSFSLLHSLVNSNIGCCLFSVNSVVVQFVVFPFCSLLYCSVNSNIGCCCFFSVHLVVVQFVVFPFCSLVHFRFGYIGLLFVCLMSIVFTFVAFCIHFTYFKRRISHVPYQIQCVFLICTFAYRHM